jgi:hypothetical protein
MKNAGNVLAQGRDICRGHRDKIPARPGPAKSVPRKTWRARTMKRECRTAPPASLVGAERGPMAIGYYSSESQTSQFAVWRVTSKIAVNASIDEPFRRLFT